MKKLLTLTLVIAITTAIIVYGAVPTTINDFFLPGSQPNQSGTIDDFGNCNCHGGYDKAVEPEFTWSGSMMSHALQDPLFYATMTIANQDAPESGDLCIRCHSPKGWLEGRSEPTDGSALTQTDRENGVNCHFCHKMVKPFAPPDSPYPNEPDYNATTYHADTTYLNQLTDIPLTEANGMYVVDDVDVRRGPYTDPSAPHDFYYSPFHKEAALCGTCHDVSNPAFTKDANGKYQPNSFDTPAPNFDPYSMFPVERTYSEWLMSEYATPDGVYAPQFGGNIDTVRTCQDCHMRDVTGPGCKKGSAPIRDDLALHDMTGGNTFIPTILSQAFPNDNINQEALDSGVVRATRMLQMASTMDLTTITEATHHDLDVKITNETGHKLPSGYPEGRRMWINVQAYNSSDQLIYESGAYDQATGVLTKDSDVKIYEIKPGISTTLSSVVSIASGPSFHFVLNDTIYSDNRIPPRGFTNAAFEAIQSPPVGYSYPDGQYWDNTEYDIPGQAAKVVVRLYYQTTSKEYVEFLRDENVTDHWGQTMYDLWDTNGKSVPVTMEIDSVFLTPTGGNTAPVLDSIGPKSVAEANLLAFRVTASDTDADPITLSTSTLPTGALFVDSGGGVGGFEWTPGYDQAGSYDVTFIASDGTADDSEVVAITVENTNRPPELDPIADTTIDENQFLGLRVTATDPDGDPITLSASDLPVGATFVDSGSGVGGFEWTPAYDQAGTYSPVFKALDANTAVDSIVVGITVNNVNREPVLASIGSKSTDEGQELAFSVSASDPDGDALTLTTGTLPTGANFVDSGGGTGGFEWTPGFDQSGNYDVMFYVSDGTAQDSELVAITVNDVNRPPVLDSIGPKAVQADSLLAFRVTASDPDSDPITLSTSTLPTGASFADSGSGVGGFEWTPTADQEGTHNVTFYASDGTVEDSEVVAINVFITNTPPTLDPIADQSTTENVQLTFTVTATDPDEPPVLSMTSPDLPSGDYFTDNGDGTGTFDWTPSYADAGIYSATFYATDAADPQLVDSQTIEITVVEGNQPPTVDPIADDTVAVGESFSFRVTAHDADGDSVALSMTNLPAGATFVDSGWSATLNAWYGTFSWIPSSGQEGSHTNIVCEVTDGIETASDTFALEVISTNCCIDIRGNADGDVDDIVDVGDLTYLIGFLFLGSDAPDCPEEGNVDGTGAIDVGDLTALIGFLFLGGESPAPCP